MNKLVIIGNGFDLAHGLPTKYEDFILWYLNKQLNNVNRKDKDDLISISSSFSNLPQYKSISDFFVGVSDKAFTVKYNFDFFRKIIKLSECNWVDVETEYYNELKNIYILFEKNGSYDKLYLQKLNQCFELLKRELENYLKIIDKNKINTHQGLIYHLETELLKEEISDGGFIKRNFHKTYYLIFNYTSTINLYLNNHTLRKNDSEVNFIHGRLNDPENPIIFGYGDETDKYYQKIEDLNENEFTKHFKSIGYFKTKNYQNLFRFIDSEEFEVCIMGHSCGVSDRVLLSSILEHKNNQRIKIYYHKKNENENDYSVKMQEISRHFKSESKHRMRLLIEPFSIDKGISTNQN